MQKIDAHEHFWKYDPVRDAWITDQMHGLKKDFLPEDVRPLLSKNGFTGCVAVQADQSEKETKFLLDLANKNDFIKGVIGWIDLGGRYIKKKLQNLATSVKLKGFRHILQAEPQRDHMLREDFRNGIRHLGQFGFTYDILIYPDQLPYSLQLVKEFPEQRFVIDHLAKPFIKFKKKDEWQRDIKQIARYKNVSCKISGFVTEADWDSWKKHEFHPYFDVVTNAFGTDRVMFGSDWPVCLLAGSYDQVVEIVNDYFSSFTKDEQEKVFGKNAIQFYNL